jgi:hypothetical protein
MIKSLDGGLALPRGVSVLRMDSHLAESGDRRTVTGLQGFLSLGPHRCRRSDQTVMSGTVDPVILENTSVSGASKVDCARLFTGYR